MDEFPASDPLSLIHLAGDEEQKNKLRILVHELRILYSVVNYHKLLLIFHPLTLMSMILNGKYLRIGNLHGQSQMLIKLTSYVKSQSLKNIIL